MKKIFNIMLICICLSGCAYSYEDRARRDMGFVSYYNFVYPPKPANHLVELYYKDNKPNDEYMVLGKIDAFIENDRDINPIIEAKVRQSGGDAAINIKTELVRIESDSHVSAYLGYGDRYDTHYNYHGAVTPYRTVNYKNAYRVSAEVVRFDIKKAVLD